MVNGILISEKFFYRIFFEVKSVEKTHELFEKIRNNIIPLDKKGNNFLKDKNFQKFNKRLIKSLQNKKKDESLWINEQFIFDNTVSAEENRFFVTTMLRRLERGFDYIYRNLEKDDVFWYLDVVQSEKFNNSSILYNCTIKFQNMKNHKIKTARLWIIKQSGNFFIFDAKEELLE